MKHSIASNAVKLTISKVITMTISMITAMLLSRFRTLEEYGTYSQIMMVIQLITTLFILGLPSSINYFLSRAENEKEKEKFISTYYTLNTILGFVVGLVLVLSTSLIIQFFDNQLISSFWYILAIYPWANIISSSIDNILIVYNKTSILLIFRILNSIFLLSAVFLVQIFRLNFYDYMIIFILGEVGFALGVYVIVKRLVGKFKINIDIQLIKTIFVFSLPIGLGSVIGTIRTELDKFIIAGFYDTKQLAIYTNAAREMPVTIIASSLTAVLLPQIVRLLKKNENKKVINLWGDVVTLSYLIICFLAIGIFAFAPDVMSFLYSEKYITGVPVFRIYAIVLLFRCTYFGMILNATGNTKLILKSTILSLIIDISLNFVLYYCIGFTGPALSTLLATLISAFYQLIMTARTLKISFKQIFPWKNIFRITILNIGLGIVFTFLKWIFNLEMILGEILESIVLAVVWAFIYFIITHNLIINKWKALNNDNNGL